MSLIQKSLVAVALSFSMISFAPAQGGMSAGAAPTVGTVIVGLGVAAIAVSVLKNSTTTSH
jgi:hypothetical protein